MSALPGGDGGAANAVNANQLNTLFAVLGAMSDPAAALELLNLAKRFQSNPNPAAANLPPPTNPPVFGPTPPPPVPSAVALGLAPALPQVSTSYIAPHPLLATSDQTGLPISLHGTAVPGRSYASPNINTQIRQGIASVDPSSGSAEGILGRYARLGHAEPNLYQQPEQLPDQNTPLRSLANPEPSPPPRPTNVGAVQTGMLVQAPVADPVQFLAWSKIMRKDTGGDPAVVAARHEEIEAILSKERDNMSYSTKKKRNAVLQSWAVIMNEFFPDLDPALYWTRNVVSAKASAYLIRRLQMSKARHGRYVTAAVVLAWLSATAWMIAKFCHEPQTMLRCGVALLTNGLYTDMESTVFTLIRDFKLVRHTKPQCYLGLGELRIIVEKMLKDSEENNRIDKMQQIAAMAFSAFTAVRPSTLAAANPDCVKEGKYMRLGDVKFLRKDSMVYDVIFDAKHFKHALSTPTGRRLEFIIFAVTKAQNVFFSGLHILLYVFARGGFGPMTLEELFNHQGAMLEVIPEKREEPFMVAGKSGQGSGLNLDGHNGGPVPALSQALGEAFRNNALNAGFCIVDFKGIRKSTSNLIGCFAGGELAAIILAHRPQNQTFNDYYSRSVANVNIIGLLTGEVFPMLPRNYHSSVAEHHDLRSIGALYMVKRNALPTVEKVGRKNNSREYSEEEIARFEEAIQDPEVQSTADALDNAIASWKETFATILTECKPRLITKVEDNAKATITQHPSLPSAFRQLEKCFGTIDNLDDDDRSKWLASKCEILSKHHELRRKYKAIKKEDNRAVIRGSRDTWGPSKDIDTTDARKKAVQDLKAPDQTSISVAHSILEKQNDPQPGSRPTTSDRDEEEEDGFEMSFSQLLTADALNVVEDPLFDTEEYDFQSRGVEDLGLTGSLKVMIEGTRKQIDALPHAEAGTDSTDDDPGDLGTPLHKLRGYDKEKNRVDSRKVLDDQGEIDIFKDITVSDMSKQLAHLILGPFYEQEARRQEMQHNLQTIGRRGLKCPICRNLDQYKDRDKLWSSWAVVKRHLDDIHSPWKDLRLKSLTSDPNIFECFRCQASFEGDDAELRLEIHFLTACPSAEEFCEIYEKEFEVEVEGDTDASTARDPDEPEKDRRQYLPTVRMSAQVRKSLKSQALELASLDKEEFLEYLRGPGSLISENNFEGFLQDVDEYWDDVKAELEALAAS